MKYLSVCSGIEAATVAWEPLGWHPVGFSEIEKFPSAVLAHHYPSVANLGDFTKINTATLGAVDLLVGGTPCQAFSVAGLRKSLDDERGNLTLSFLRLSHELADGNGLRGFVWENVPGVLSTKDNAFGCFLGGIVGSGEPVVCNGRWPNSGMVSGPKGKAAWRVLDAQYFGLAQRRRRVFVVGSFGNWFDPAAVLFERQGLRRNPPTRGETREDITHPTAPCLTSSGRGVERTGDTRGQDPVVAVNNRADSSLEHGCWWDGGQVSQTLDAVLYKGQTMPEKNRFPAVLVPKCVTGDVTHTLKADGFDASEDGAGRGQPIVPCAVALRGREGGATAELGDDKAFSLRASGGGGKPHVLTTYAIQERAVCENPNAGPGGMGVKKEQAYTLEARTVPQPVAQSAVRRITPRECERLQGFPDDYTLVEFGPRKKKLEDDYIRYLMRGGTLTKEQCFKRASDGPRYKALGNSMAVPCMRWIGQRIAAQVAENNRLAA